MEEEKKEIEEQESSQKTQNGSGRSTFLMVFAGIYLLYTGYTLCKNVLDGQEGAGWGFFAVGVIFIVIAVVMLFYGIKNYSARAKEGKNADAADGRSIEKNQETAEEMKVVEASADSMEHTDVPNRPMTIAERARLAGRLEDAVGDTEETE
ncbi:MAG: DUF308 domain-containing protein [Eubacteriales bacterium]|nr:DUF308 domain-containing protein [Eubacteriales bacterium]